MRRTQCGRPGDYLRLSTIHCTVARTCSSLSAALPPRAGITYRRARIELTAGKKTVTRTVTPRTVGARARKRIVIPVSLTGLPKGVVRLTITVTTRGDHVLTAKRTLRTCATKAGKRRGR